MLGFGRDTVSRWVHTLVILIAALLPAALPAAAIAQGNPAETAILIRGADIYDGRNEVLTKGSDVLIRGNRIAEIGAGLAIPAGATVIDGQGKTVMPGLIDMHWHSLLSSVPKVMAITGDFGDLVLAGAKANEGVLLRGFTTVRDAGGNSFPIKRASDRGLFPGPRIYPSGAFIGQTSGHGDFRLPTAVPTPTLVPFDYMAATGNALIADGVPAVLQRVREVLRMGASQVKVMAGGGVSSLYDPLDTTQYTFEEMKAAVDVARTWNTYVMVHAYTDAAVRQAIEAGVLCIEHGHLLTDDTLKLMAERGIWLSIQPFLDDEDANPQPNPDSRAKQLQVSSGTERVYRLAKKYGVKTVFGTDILFDARLATRQGAQLAKLTRWFTPHEALMQATSTAGELLKLSGARDPYPGKLGVIEPDALADVLVVNGNPLADISLVADPAKNFVVIIKDGTIYKNDL